MGKQILIAAPHIDDEVIGCFSVLTNADSTDTITVMYTDVESAYRLLEARYAALALNFTFTVSPTPEEVTAVLERGHDEVYAPSRRDEHEAHKRLAALCAPYATHTYACDMRHGRTTLSQEQQAEKLRLLDQCYPSQRQLWANNAKYFLFEHIVPAYSDSQCVVYTRVRLPDDGMASARICVKHDYVKAVRELPSDLPIDVLTRRVAAITIHGDIRIHVQPDGPSTDYEIIL